MGAALRWCRHLRMPAIGLASLLVTACGGGGAGTSGLPEGGLPLPQPVATLLKPYAQPGSGEAFTEADARHLLRRIAFSAPQAEVDRCVRDGLLSTVDRLLNAPRDAAAEAAADALVEDPVRPDLWQLQKSWLSLMATTNAPVREKMALFWHQRLAVSGRQLGGSNLRWMREYRDLLRAHGLGNWRTLLKGLTRNGAMLVWLTGLPSDKAHPNENYAREFWELFTLGVDVRYTQQDITEAARAYTGWDSRWDETTELESLYFNAEAHDEGEKTILGRTGNWREDDVVDLTLDTPEAAEFLARRIFEGLAYRGAEPEIVTELAQLARDGSYEIKPLVRMVVLSKAFYSGKARKTQVADPVIQMVGTARATGIPFEAHDLLCSAETMGQVPLDPPSVKGFAQGLGWSGEQPLLMRAGTMDAIAGTDHTHDAEGNDLAHVGVDHLLPQRDAEGRIAAGPTVDRVARVLDVSLSPAERAVLVAYMDTTGDDDGRDVPSPFDGNDPGQVEVKVRGLLSILSQHPDAMKH